RIGGNTTQFFADEIVFTDRLVPLNTGLSPPTHRRETLFESSQTSCWKRQTSNCERGKRDPQAVLFAAQAIFNRDIYVVERRYAVVNPSHALESQTGHSASRPLRFNNEGPKPFLCVRIAEFLRAIHDPSDDDEHGRQKLAVPLSRVRNEK